jgi:hypothetical protein
VDHQKDAHDEEAKFNLGAEKQRREEFEVTAAASYVADRSPFRELAVLIDLSRTPARVSRKTTALRHISHRALPPDWPLADETI